MRKTLLGAVALVLGMTGAALADPADGVWQTEVDDGAYAHVTIAPCGGAVCGTISRTFDATGEYTSPNIGRQIIIDMAPQGGGEYEGSVWRPSNDRIYIGRMTLAGNSITLRGCVAGGLICARQNWTRVQ
jgi:uncharacterized protein (DUF2147 family)